MANSHESAEPKRDATMRPGALRVAAAPVALARTVAVCATSATSPRPSPWLECVYLA